MADLKVTVEFLDGRPNLEVEMNASYPPGKEPEACLKLLAQINMTGGILEFLEDGLSLIPLQTIKKIYIKAPSIVGANMGDLAALKRRGPNA